MMTRTEKDAVREMPCGQCEARPPFADGSRCHPHRIDPARGYVHGNVVPRCPPCHAAEPGHPPITKDALKGGRAGGLATGRRKRRDGLTEKELAHQRANGRKFGALGAKAANERVPPDQRQANSRAGGLSLGDRKRREGLTPAELAHAQGHGRRQMQAINSGATEAERSERALKGWATRRKKKPAKKAKAPADA